MLADHPEDSLAMRPEVVACAGNNGVLDRHTIRAKAGGDALRVGEGEDGVLFAVDDQDAGGGERKGRGGMRKGQGGKGKGRGGGGEEAV